MSRKANGRAGKGGLIGTLGTLATAAAGGLMSITLMACYGIAYTCDVSEDKDGDGFIVSNDPGCNIPTYERDCNDDDATINPGAADPLGDGIDQNCDGHDGGGETTTGSGGTGGASTGGTGGTGGVSTGGTGGVSTGGTGGTGGVSTGGTGGTSTGTGGTGGG